VRLARVQHLRGRARSRRSDRHLCRAISAVAAARSATALGLTWRRALARCPSSKRCSRSYKFASISQSSELEGLSLTVSSASEVARCRSPSASQAAARPCATSANKALPPSGGNPATALSNACRAICGRCAASSHSPAGAALSPGRVTVRLRVPRRRFLPPIGLADYRSPPTSTRLSHLARALPTTGIPFRRHRNCSPPPANFRARSMASALFDASNASERRPSACRTAAAFAHRLNAWVEFPCGATVGNGAVAHWICSRSINP
jgi:hypothetical protein